MIDKSVLKIVENALDAAYIEGLKDSIGRAAWLFDDFYYCSNCYQPVPTDKYEYCPMCGYVMDVKFGNKNATERVRRVYQQML